ncbi:hypothetical protein [Simplicispira piscis]
MASQKPGTPPATPTKKPAPRNNGAGAATPEKRKRIDWEAVERDYRTGHFTLRELEAKHGVSFAQISRKAKELQWSKDLREVIKQATDAALLRETVTDAQKDATETVLVAAEINKQVILGHRAGLRSIADVKHALLGQIAQAAEMLPDLAEVIEMVRMPDENGIDRANDALRKAMSRSALVDDLKKLADVDEKVRKGEREAFGLDDDPADKQEQQGPKMTDAQLALRITNLMSRAKVAK